MRARHKNLLNFGALLLPGALALMAWQYAVQDSARLVFLFSSPQIVFERGLAEYAHANIWKDIAITTFEAVCGLIFGSLLGTATALVLWASAATRKIAQPYMTILGAIPVFALAPVLIIWFGIGLPAKIILAALGVYLIATVQTFQGFHATAAQHINYARMLGARNLDIMTRVLLPGAMRWLITGLRINIGVAILGAFIGEFISSQAGLGHYIIQAGQVYDIAGALFGLFNLSVLALLLDCAARRLVPPALKPV